MDIQAGSVVYSKAGRDRAKMLLVLKTDNEYAYVADGELRTVDKLKKKKLKHLQKTNICVKMEAATLTNSDIRKILAQYKPNN